MELYVWASPIEGLVSIDYHCIAAVAYIQIAAKGQFSIVPCTTPGLSPTGQLPFLKDGSEWIGGLPSIIRFLLKHGHDADAALNASQKAISSAYASLVYDRLCDVIVSTRRDSIRDLANDSPMSIMSTTRTILMQFALPFRKSSGSHSIILHLIKTTRRLL